MSDGAKMVDVSENILQGFYGQSAEVPKQNSKESNNNLEETATPTTPESSEDSDIEFPIPPTNENLPHEELNGVTISESIVEERIRNIAAKLANIRTKSTRYRLDRRLRAIGLELRMLADSFLLPEHHVGFIALKEAILTSGVQTEEEKLVVNLIDSYTRENEELPPTIISQICQHLQNCVTSSTFRTALQYLCYNSHSVPEELAAACDLAFRIYPRFQDLERADSVYNELGEFIEKTLDDVIY